MEARRTGRDLLASFVLAALAAQAFVAVVESRASPAEKASQGIVHLLELCPLQMKQAPMPMSHEGGAVASKLAFYFIFYL
jgi:hypothetical protein